MCFPLYSRYITFIPIAAGLSSLFISHLLLVEVNKTEVHVAKTGKFWMRIFNYFCN